MSNRTQAACQPLLASVDFHGHSLTVVTTASGEHLVAMKPICEAIGLDWKSQYSRIQRNQVLKEGMVVMTTPSAGGDQETTCLPLDYLNGWLFGVDASRVRPEIRERLVQYQRECFAALAAYWQQGEAVNPRRRKAAAPKALPGLNPEQQNTLKTLVKARVEALPRERQAKAAVTCWSALKSKFGCSYKEIAPEHFTEAVSLVARVVLEGEWLGAATNSFAGLIGQPLKRGERWLVSLDAQGRERFEPVPYDACVMTHQELLQAMVTPGELPVSTEEMFELAMSALVNLKARSDFQARRLAGLKPAQPPV